LIEHLPRQGESGRQVSQQRIPDLFGKFGLSVSRKTRRFDGRENANLNQPGIGSPIVFAHDVAGPANGHRQNRGLGFEGDEKYPFFKRLEIAVRASGPFGENQNRDPVPDFLGGLDHAAVGLFGAVPFNRYIAGAAHGPAEEGDAEQFRFGDPSELKGKIAQKGEDVKKTLVI